MAKPWEKFQNQEKSPAKPSGPWDKFKGQAPVSPKMSEVESGLWGAVDTGSLGFADEGEGGVKAVASTPVRFSRDYLSDLVENYKKSRDEARGRYSQAEHDNPKSYLAGQVAGGVGTALIPGAGILNAGKTLKGAALIGGATGLGSSDADLTEGEFGRAALDTGVGATLGGVTQGALNQVGKLAPPVEKYLQDFANKRATKVATGANKSALKKMGSEKIDRLGASLLEADEAGPAILSATDRTESLYPKLQEKRDYFGKKIGEVGSEIDKTAPGSVDNKAIAQKIREYKDSLAPSVKNKAVKNMLEEEAAIYDGLGDGIGFETAQKHKGNYRWNEKDPTTQSFGEQATNNLYKILGESQENTAKNFGETLRKKNVPEEEVKRLEELLGKYKGYKSKYGDYESGRKAAQDRVIQNFSNRMVSPSTYMTGLAAGVSDIATGGVPVMSALKAATAGVANKVAVERGSAFAAKTANAMAKSLAETPERLGKYGPALQKVAATKGVDALNKYHAFLLENDPNYRKTMEGLDQ